MKITAEELKQHYASLPDAALLALDREELMDLARQCYDAEVARRGLAHTVAAHGPAAAAAPAPQREAYEADEPVVVATFVHNESDANLARTTLQAAQIPCFLEGEHTRWYRGTPGLRLMVPASCLEQARGVLEQEAPAPTEPAPPEPWDGKLEHRFVETNGIRMHYVEAGAGPLVLLLHGFPESWYAWRHQLPALAAEGYHAVAPDLRGYGQTDRPEPLEAYDIFQLTGDIVGLVNALGEAPAVIAGHDWGAWIAPCCALLRPDLFRAVALLSVPFVPRGAVNQTQWEAEKYPGKVFYQAMLRSPMAEQFFAGDVRGRLLAGLWTLSGDAAADDRWRPVRDTAAGLVAPRTWSDLPPWLTRDDLDFLAAEFTRTGFTGGLNYYRNMDRNWALTPFLDGARLLQRTLFLAGEKDPVLEFLGDEYDSLEANAPNLWRKQLIPGAGHWIQQERPAEVNALLLDFLREIEADARA